MPPADPGRPDAVPAPETADDLNDATLIVRRSGPRHGAAVQAPGSEPNQSAEPVEPVEPVEPDDDQTRIVQRTTDEHTRVVQRKPAVSRPDRASEAPGDDAQPTDDSTVRSSRGSAADDTLLSGRRAASAAPTPVVDALQRRYEPPQVRSGSSVRYAARPAPAVVEAPAPASASTPDPTRIALAAAAALIRQRTLAKARHRRRLTLAAIVTSTLLLLLGAAAFTAFALMTW
jgi:hypothetical protein